MPCAMPVPAHLSTASARTHQRMTAVWRSGSGSTSTIAASLGCMAVTREQTHPAASRSTSTPTGWLDTATTTESPECAREKDRPGAGVAGPAAPGTGGLASTGLPEGPAQVGHGSRVNARLPGSVPR